MEHQEMELGSGALGLEEASRGESPPPLTSRSSFNVIFNLAEDELERLEPALKQKLIENGENYIQQHDNLRINYERLKTEFEQRFMDLDAEYSECKSKLAAELESSYLYKTKANDFGTRIHFIIVYSFFLPVYIILNRFSRRESLVVDQANKKARKRERDLYFK